MICGLLLQISETFNFLHFYLFKESFIEIVKTKPKTTEGNSEIKSMTAAERAVLLDNAHSCLMTKNCLAFLSH